MLNDRKEKIIKHATIAVEPEDYAAIDSIETTRFQLGASAVRCGKLRSGITKVMRSILLEQTVGQAGMTE